MAEGGPQSHILCGTVEGATILTLLFKKKKTQGVQAPTLKYLKRESGELWASTSRDRFFYPKSKRSFQSELAKEQNCI